MAVFHRTATIAHLTSDMPLRRSLRHLMVLLLLCGVLLSGWLAYVVALRVGQAQIQATGLHRLELYTASLQREISKYAFLPGTLDLEKEVLALLAPDASAAQAEEVSAYLEQLNERAGTLSIYVINLDGRVVATSNWRRPDSFMGEDLQFRPYFRDALSSGTGRLFGIGTTRGEPEGTEMASVYPVTGRFLTQARALPGTPWTITVFSNMARADEAAQSYALIASTGTAFLALLGFMLNQRRRHQRDRVRDRLAAREALQAAHDELERKVQQRTSDLQQTNERLQQEVQERIRAEATRRAAQNELVQAGKLAVIGQLSTGVAHELNQPLTALRTLSGNSLRFLERGDLATVQINLERIAQLADRMGLITGELRAFARKSSGEPGAVPVRAALGNALAVLESRIQQTGAKVDVQVAETEPVAWCDGNRLEQVLVNLINNALDAMAGAPTPCVHVRCELLHGQVHVQVRDHGPGLSEEAIAHLFEPFFTTKSSGDGLGLGLALSAGIVRESGGTLGGANHPGGGAVFHLTLPAAQPGQPQPS